MKKYLFSIMAMAMIVASAAMMFSCGDKDDDKNDDSTVTGICHITRFSVSSTSSTSSADLEEQVANDLITLFKSKTSGTSATYKYTKYTGYIDISYKKSEFETIKAALNSIDGSEVSAIGKKYTDVTSFTYNWDINDQTFGERNYN